MLGRRQTDPGMARAAGLCALCAVAYRLLALAFGLAGGGLLALWLAGPGAGAPPGRLELLTWWVNLAGGAVSLAVPVWLAVRLGGLRAAGLRLRRPRPGVTGQALVLYLGGAQLAGLAAAFVAKTTGSGQEVPLPQSPAALVPAWLGLCILPALLEELLFRGAMQGLVRPWGAWAAIFAQAVPFALLHQGAAAVVFALAAGVFFGWLAERTGSILPGMCIHLVNNSLAFGLRLLPLPLAAALNLGLLVLCPLAALAVLAAGRKRGLRRAGLSGRPALLLGCPAWLAVQLGLVLCAVFGL